MRITASYTRGATLVIFALSLSFAFAAELKTTTVQGVTVSDKTAAIMKGGCDSDPYPYLEQRHRGDRSNSFVTPRPQSDGSLRNGLDPGLACRLKKLLEAAEAKGCRITINSAMRPVQRCNQGGGACAPQGRSCHQYGLAADLGGTPQCLNWLTSVIGRKNSGSPFGLHVAYVENGNYRHVQCIEHLAANCHPSTPPCGNGAKITPDSSSLPNPSDSAFGPRSIGDAFRSATGLGQQSPPTAIPPQQATMQPQQYFNPTNTGQPAQTGSPSGSSGSSGIGGSSNIGVPIDNRPPISDQLLNLAYGTSTIGGSTHIATSVPLVVSGKDASGLPLHPVNSGTGNVSVTPSIVSLQPTQTFTSVDPYSEALGDTNSRTQMLQLLETMKQRLLNILEYLRPFGIRQAAGGEEYHEHFAE